MATTRLFDETTSRYAAALAENIGQTPEEYLGAYARDIHRAVRDRGGIEAIESENAARRDARDAAAIPATPTEKEDKA